MAKRKKTRFSKVKGFIAKNMSFREVKKLFKSVAREMIGESDGDKFRRIGRIVRNSGGGSGNFFGPSLQQRSWSSLTKGLGAKILRMGPNVPPEIREAAQDAVDGVGDYRNERELQDVLRGGLGIQRSGAKRLNRFVRSVRGHVQGIASAGVMYDQAQRGGVTGGAAQAALTDMFLGKAEEIARSKFVEKAAVSFANMVGHNPLKYVGALHAIGRGIRLGGAIGAAGQIAVSVLDEHAQQRGRAGRAQLSAFNAASAAGIDASHARNIRRNVGVVRETGIVGEIKSLFGFNADAEEERAKRQGDVYRMINSAQKVAGRLGIDVAAMLAAEAEKRDIAVEDLNDTEIKRVLQPVLTVAARGLVSSDSIQNELVKRGVVPNSNLGTNIKIAGKRIHIDMKKVQSLTDLFLPEEEIERRNKMIEAEGKKIETEFATRKLEELATESQKIAAANAARGADIPAQYIEKVFQGQGGEITRTKILNPAYTAWRAERRKTQEQMRDFTAQRASYARRKQVVFTD